MFIYLIVYYSYVTKIYTTLKLSYLAANRVDGFITFSLSSYDYTAGVFLAKSAGASISIFEEEVWKPWESSIKDLFNIKDRIMFVSHKDTHQMFLEDIGNPKLLN